MQEDWDNIIILDGCRYDVFSDRGSISGKLQKVTSLGSQSLEFFRKNFSGGTYHDTVFVSANPYTDRLESDVFHNVIELFTDHWDSELKTVPPKPVVDAALAAHESYPDKRLIVHFMQPHFPFIGEKGQKLSHSGLAGHPDYETGSGEKQNSYPVWSNLRYGFTDITEQEVWKAYIENLDVVLPYVKTLCEEFRGKSVVTADHGNLMGERIWPIPVKGYGHPTGLRISELVEVPWLEVNNSNRREITAEPPIKKRTSADEELIEERLRDLGYRT